MGNMQSHAAPLRAVFACAAVALVPAMACAKPLTLAWQLTHSVQADPSFAPDGKRMVYIVGVAGKEQLFASNVDGSDPVQLTHDGIDHEDPAWSPDGKRIAFVAIDGIGSR